MDDTLTFSYDQVGDILYIDKVSPYEEQDSIELGDEMIARLNPTTGEIVNVEILFFSKRLSQGNHFQLPVSAHLRLPVAP